MASLCVSVSAAVLLILSASCTNVCAFPPKLSDVYLSRFILLFPFLRPGVCLLPVSVSTSPGYKHHPGPACGEASLFVPEEPSPPSSPLQQHRSTSEVTLRPLSSSAGKPPGDRPVRLPGPVLHAALQEWELMELHGGHRTSGQPLYCQGVFDAITMGEQTTTTTVFLLNSTPISDLTIFYLIISLI